MKLAIIAGGRGTRLAEETDTRPKALVEIGGRPILWHIMKYYAGYGIREVVIALGHKGDMIRTYFAEGAAAPNWVVLDERPGCVVLESKGDPPSTVELVDTGPTTGSGGRIKRLAPYLGERTFLMTWCDGLGDVDLRALIAFHASHGRLATLTAVHPPPRFGRLELEGDRVVCFAEKPDSRDEWINGAFFVVEPRALGYIDGDATEWERGPLPRLAREGELMAYRHERFWQCMDTLHERRALEALWQSGAAPWKVWR